MSNMSYCRFQNTSCDLADCEMALDDLINEDRGPLSDDEALAAQRLIRRCQRILIALSVLPHQMNLANDSDEIDEVNFDFDCVIDQLQENARMRGEDRE